MTALAGHHRDRTRSMPPVGLGEPTFDKLDGLIGQAMLSIPAVKAVEIGEGLAVTRSRGSEANDYFQVVDGACSHPHATTRVDAGRDLDRRRDHRPDRGQADQLSCADPADGDHRPRADRDHRRGSAHRRLPRVRFRWPRRCWRIYWPISCCGTGQPESESAINCSGSSGGQSSAGWSR